MHLGRRFRAPTRCLGNELSRDRAVTADKEGTLHTHDDGGINIGFRVWRYGTEPAKQDTLLALNGPGSRKRVDKPSPIMTARAPSASAMSSSSCPTFHRREILYQAPGLQPSDRYAGGAASFLRYAVRADTTISSC